MHLIHGVDSLKLLQEINKQSEKINKVTTVLLQIHIAEEETKFGLDEEELNLIISEFDNLKLKNINIIGLMGMATNTNNEQQIRKEFEHLKASTNC